MATITITGVSTDLLAKCIVAYFCIKSDSGNAITIQASKVNLGVYDVNTDDLEEGDKVVFLLIAQYGGILKVEYRFEHNIEGHYSFLWGKYLLNIKNSQPNEITKSNNPNLQFNFVDNVGIISGIRHLVEHIIIGLKNESQGNLNFDCEMTGFSNVISLNTSNCNSAFKGIENIGYSMRLEDGIQKKNPYILTSQGIKFIEINPYNLNTLYHLGQSTEEASIKVTIYNG